MNPMRESRLVDAARHPASQGMHPIGLSPRFDAWSPPRPFPTLHPVAANDFDIHYVADLARLQLTPEEEQRLGSQLGNILGYVEQLRTVNVSGVEPTSHAFPLVNVTRPDVARPGIPQEEALQNAPLKSNGLFIVPKIVE